METNIFAAGTAPGSPSSETEIKTLICYVLGQVGKPMTFPQLHEAFSENQWVNYFQLHDALKELGDTQHIEKTEADNVFSYHLTDLGRKTGETLSSSLPHTVKSKATESADKALSRSKRLSEVSIVTSPIPSGGYNIALSLPEEGYDLAAFSIFAPTKEEAEKIRLNFLNHPTYIYSCVMALLTGDQSLLFPIEAEESLF